MRRVLIIGMAIAMSCVANAKAKSSAWITDYDGDQARILKTLMSSNHGGQNDDQKPEDENKGKEDQKDDQYQNGDQTKNDQDQDKKHDKWDPKKFMRVDCRYHNDEEIKGIEHCYASAIYKPTKWGYEHVHLGIGCDAQTIYNDRGRVQTEQVGERISPPTAAFPAIELSPEGALRSPGTYESTLDIRAGRMAGTCYVHRLEEDGHHGHDKGNMDDEDQYGDKEDEDGKYNDEEDQNDKDRA